VETKSQEFNPLLSSCYDRGKILIEDDGKNGGGKGRVGEIIHRPPKDLSLLNGHIFLEDRIRRWEDKKLVRNNIKDFTPFSYHSNLLIFFKLRQS
jgi:hypothetical protein